MVLPVLLAQGSWKPGLAHSDLLGMFHGALGRLVNDIASYAVYSYPLYLANMDATTRIMYLTWLSYLRIPVVMDLRLWGLSGWKLQFPKQDLDPGLLCPEILDLRFIFGMSATIDLSSSLLLTSTYQAFAHLFILNALIF